MLRIAFILLTTIISFSVAAQTKLPVILASSDKIDIRNGKDFSRGNWTLAPDYRPDIYTSNKVGERITFYTDLDSISCVLDKNKPFDFIILYHGKDSCYTQVKYEPSYLDKLKKAAAFDYSQTNSLPKFTYQDASDPHLVALRKGFNLDSIAGSANELNQQLNLLHWIHNLIPHDGSHENPEVKNAMSMINVCQQGKRGLNCRGLSTVLNDCYLAMGWKSRYMTCMPKDSVFNDCHVINMVYSNDLSKWIWLDPTNDAYVMDENGILLNFDEVRERLINNQPLLLNPNANWNNKFTTTKENYLYNYMAKNLYRFECPLHSEYNYETWKKGKKVDYVELIPLDGYNQTPKVKVETNKKTGVTFTTYKTNNPKEFFALPTE